MKVTQELFIMCAIILPVCALTMSPIFAEGGVQNGKLGIPLTASEYRITKCDRKPSEFAEESKGAETWVTEVVLNVPAVHIPVMQEDSYEWAGALIDPDAETGIRCTWLVKDKLLGVSWDTTSTGGSGVWSKEGYIVVLIEGSQTRVLLANAVNRVVQFGADCRSEGSIQFEVEPNDKKGKPRISRHVTRRDRQVEKAKLPETAITLDHGGNSSELLVTESYTEIVTLFTLVDDTLAETGYQATTTVCKSWADGRDGNPEPEVNVADLCASLMLTEVTTPDERARIKTALQRENPDVKDGKVLNCREYKVSCKCSPPLIDPGEAGYDFKSRDASANNSGSKSSGK